MPWKERPGLGEIGSWSGRLEVFHLTHLDSLYLLSIYYVPSIAVGIGESSDWDWQSLWSWS